METTWWARHGETVWASIVAIVIALVFGFYFFRKSEKSRDLGFKEMVKQAIISIHNQENLLATMKLEVLVNNYPVASPNLVIVRIMNIGKRAIEKAQLTDGIVFHFPNAKILQASLAGFEGGITSEEVSSVTDVATGEIAVYPNLLNPSDGFNIIFITDGNLEFPVISSRIVEGKLHNLTEAYVRRNRKVNWALLISIPLIYLVLLINGFVYHGNGAGSVYVNSIAISATIGAIALSVFNARKRW